MPTFRDIPYSAFNFLVELEAGQGSEVLAGFSEVSGLSAEVTVAEYRVGNSLNNYVTKIPGIHKSGDITFKRGVTGSENIWQWLKEARAGSMTSKRDVTVKLMSENRDSVVVTWVLRGAIPIKWTGPTLAAKGGGDVAMEELVLSIENIEES
ncbi:MAG: phage tail protein [Oceanospirillaceae bacterium]